MQGYIQRCRFLGTTSATGIPKVEQLNMLKEQDKKLKRLCRNKRLKVAPKLGRCLSVRASQSSLDAVEKRIEEHIVRRCWFFTMMPRNRSW